MPAGRPTKLTKKLVEQVQQYAGGQYQELGHIIPSIAGLSEFLNVPRETLQRWKSENETPLQNEFHYILEVMLSRQERLLLDSGLQGTWNSNIVKLVLGKHGYSDKFNADIKNTENIYPVTILELPDDGRPVIDVKQQKEAGYNLSDTELKRYYNS